MIPETKTKSSEHHSSRVPRWPAGTPVQPNTGAGGGRFMSRGTIFRGKQKIKEAEATDISDETSAQSEPAGFEYAEGLRQRVLKHAESYDALKARSEAQYEAATQGRTNLLARFDDDFSLLEQDEEALLQWRNLSFSAQMSANSLFDEKYKFSDDVALLLRAPNPATVPFEYDDSYIDEDVNEYVQHETMQQGDFKEVWGRLTSMIDESVIETSKVAMVNVNEGTGGMLEAGGIFIGHQTGENVLWHEMGHWIEWHNPHYWNRVTDFLAKRHPYETAGHEGAETVKVDENGNPLGRHSYMSYKDDYVDPYIGKVYTDDDNVNSNHPGETRYATEITSMGLELLRRDPGLLAKGDPDMFNHLISWMHGIDVGDSTKAIPGGVRNRDISHVLRDEHGRWTDTPGVGDDAPKEQSDTGRQRKLDEDIKPDINSADFEEMIRASLKKDHDNLGGDDTADFFMESWKQADTDAKGRLYEAHFERFLGPLKPATLDRVIEEVGPERKPKKFSQIIEPSFDPIREMTGPTGISPADFIREMPPKSPFRNRQELIRATETFWGVGSDWESSQSPLAWGDVVDKVNGKSGYGSLPAEAGTEYYMGDDKSGILSQVQADWLREVPQAAYDARLSEIRSKLGLSTNLGDPASVLSQFGVAEIYDPNQLHADDVQAWRASLAFSRGKAAEMMQKIDPSKYTRAEIMDSFNGYMDEIQTRRGVDNLLKIDSGEDRDGNIGWLMYENVMRPMRNEYESSIRQALALGQIEPELADMLSVGGSKTQGIGGWVELPEELYHTTTNANAIIGDRLRSRRELGQNKGGLGLGGGEDDTISFTASAEVGRDIERSLHEAWYVTNGMLNTGDMYRIAQRGGGGVGRPWVKDLLDFQTAGNADWVPDNFDIDNPEHRAMMPERVQKLLRVEEGLEDPPEPKESYEPAKEDYLNEEAWEMWHGAYASSRELSGGFMNPLFFSTDWKGLGASNPGEFKTLKLTPRKGAKGYLMGALGEWRTVGGQTVSVTEAINHFDYKQREDYEEIVGWKNG